MTEEQVKAVLDRVSNWPSDKQRELVQVALEIEAEIAGTPYSASADELKAIDEGLAGDAASEDEVEAAFAKFRSEWVSNTRDARFWT